MTCRHKPGDPSCSKSDAAYYRQLTPDTPDSNRFEILDFWQIGTYLIVKVKYPNCVACAFEGVKILVYENLLPSSLVFWKNIDPHFRQPARSFDRTVAPPPIARFPCTEAGLRHARIFCEALSGKTTP